MSLDKLFHHILLTEQKVSEQTRLMQDVKAAISKYQEQIKTTTEELNCAKNQLEEKCKVLIEYGLQMEQLKKCNDSREKQREELLTQQRQLKETSEEARCGAAEERDRFMEEILSFNAEFNLLMDRQAREETRAREEMETMDREEKSLNEEMERMTQGHAGILSLQAEKSVLQEEISQLQRLKNEVAELKEGELSDVRQVLRSEIQQLKTVSPSPSDLQF
ncbi:coiled-coil domain-containing protein 172 isoform X2 [Conger conger]|uniref:coiled-coil domain-containing protein 172 isoform X2 n=1 Tax=Conger conger TaxID=82655 RepID=UPI002A5A163C|nr:coiled-coil domain-containing protein 172 isoform X2 [Conger conger]